MKKKYTISSRIWLWNGPAAWHFIPLPKKDSEAIKKSFGKNARGWGSLPVQVRIGETKWNTSIFPDKKSGAYLLPLKAAVRKKEGLFADDEVDFTLEVGG